PEKGAGDAERSRPRTPSTGPQLRTAVPPGNSVSQLKCTYNENYRLLHSLGGRAARKMSSAKMNSLIQDIYFLSVVFLSQPVLLQVLFHCKIRSCALIFIFKKMGLMLIFQM
ncbi:hypothetical protein AMECASPLE_013670, partial [Ameca splendens]